MLIGKIPLILARWSYRNPKTVFALGVVLSVVMGLFASRLELHNDFVELLPPKLKQVKTIRYVLAETGGVSYQAVTTVSPNQAQNRKFLSDIRTRLNHYFWEPNWSSARRIQEEYERVGQILRGVLRYGKHADPYEKHQLSMRIKNLDKVPMVDYALDRYDRKFFQDRQLLFLSTSDLQTIYKRLRKQIGSATIRGMGLGLDDDSDSKKQKKKKKIKINFSDIEKKYKDQLQQLPHRIEVKKNGIYSNALMIRPRGASTDLIFTQKFVNRLQKTIGEMQPKKKYEPKMKVWLQGAYRNNLREFEGINRDVRNSIVGTFVLLVMLVLAFFRRLRVLWLVPLPLVMGTICTFGVTYLTIGYLTTVTGFIGALLFGLGIDYGVFFMDRYFQERRAGETVENALEICYSWAGTAIATAALTTAAGFFALTVCRFRGFTQFGFIGGVGITFCLLSMMTILPALIAVTDRWKPMKPPSAKLKASKLMGKPYPFAFLLTLIGVGAVALSFYTLPRVPSEVNMKRLGFRNAGTVQDSRRWRRFDNIFHQNGMVPVIFLTNNEAATRYLTQEVLRRGKKARKQYPNKKVIIQAFSPFDFIPKEQEKKLRIIRKMKRYLEKNEDEIIDNKEGKKFYQKYKPLFAVASFGVNDLPGYLQRDLVLHNRDDFTKVKGYIVAIVSDFELSNGNEARKLNRVLQNTPFQGKRYDPSGEPIIFAELNRVIELDSFVAVGASLLAIAFLVLLDLRNWRLTLLALWPLLTGLLGLTIFLYFFDIRVNMFNMVVFPALLGIGVDAGVHMLHRYREKPSLGTLGVPIDLMGPIAVAACTTVISFATMITAQHMGMRSVGILAVAGLTTCLFSTFVLLPAIMELLFRKFPLQTKAHPSNEPSSSSENPSKES